MPASGSSAAMPTVAYVPRSALAIRRDSAAGSGGGTGARGGGGTRRGRQGRGGRQGGGEQGRQHERTRGPPAPSPHPHHAPRAAQTITSEAGVMVSTACEECEDELGRPGGGR